MKTTSSEVELLEQIDPLDMFAYLQKTGWIQETPVNQASTIWSKWDATRNCERELLLPSREVGDYVLRLAEALEELSSFEGRPRLEIVLDLQASGGLRRVLRVRNWMDDLVRLWGLDVFGLTGWSRVVVTELRALALTLSTLLLFNIIFWSILFLMLFDSRLWPLALALGTIFSLGAAVYQRSFMIAGFSARRRGAGRFIRVLVFPLMAVTLGLITSQPLALLLFRGPIDAWIVNSREPTTDSKDFFYRIRVLHILLEEDSEPSKLFRRSYFAVVSVSLIIPMLPATVVLLGSEEIKSYYKHRRFDETEEHEEHVGSQL